MSKHIELICIIKTSDVSYCEGKVKPVPPHIRRGGCIGLLPRILNFHSIDRGERATSHTGLYTHGTTFNGRLGGPHYRSRRF